MNNTHVFFAIVFALTTSCAKRDSAAEVKVLGGVETNYFPAIVKIRNLATNGFCTGTFVNDTTMLTASHCITAAEDSGNVAIDSDHSKKAIARYYHNQAVEFGCTDQPYLADQVDVCPPIDGAMLVFPAGTAASLGITSFPEVAKAPVDPDEKITIYGYGPKIEGGPDGIKTYSSTHVESTTANRITATVADMNNATPGQDAGVLPGDSGGPVFDSQGRLVGVNSGFQFWDGGFFRSYMFQWTGDVADEIRDFAAEQPAPFRPAPF